MIYSIREYFADLRRGDKKSIILTILFIVALVLSMNYSPWSDKANDIYYGPRYVFFGISEVFEIISYIIKQANTAGNAAQFILVFYIFIFALFPYFRYAMKEIFDVENSILCYMAENIFGYLVCWITYLLGGWLFEMAKDIERYIVILIVILFIFGVILYYFTLFIAAIEIFHFSLYLWWAILLKIAVDYLPGILTNYRLNEGTIYLIIKIIMFVATILIMFLIENVIMQNIDELVFESEGGPFGVSLMLFEPIKNWPISIAFILIYIDVIMVFKVANHVGLL